MNRNEENAYNKLLRQMVTDLDFAIAGLDMSRAEAARRAGLAPGTVYRILNNLKPNITRHGTRYRTRDPKLSTLFRLGRGIGIDISIEKNHPMYREIKEERKAG